MTCYEKWQLLLSGVTLLIASISAYVGLSSLRSLIEQIKEAAESNRLNRLDALLSIETTLYENRRNFSDIGLKLGEIGDELTKLKNNKSTAKKEISDKQKQFDNIKLRYDEYAQLYLNSLDRLCFCFLNNLLNEEEYRPEYRNYINETVNQFGDIFSKANCPYRNIKKIYDKWADS
ncbi:MAG: hypothetical protein GC179_30755 [Anaerolineaceae bacterium]|nr:hypothetical protein [Anaerolineaceae bacterium]